MRRRALLASLAAAGTVTAGCLGDGAGTNPVDGDTATPTPTDGLDPTDERGTPTDGSGSTDDGTPVDAAIDAEVDVASLTLQHGLVVPTTPDSIAVHHEEHRYLWATVTVRESPLDLDAFSLRVGEETVPPLAADDRRPYRTQWGDEEYFDGSIGTGLILFELPVQADVDVLAFQSPAGTVAADAALVERLRTAPPAMDASLVKRYAETPDEPVAVAVTNTGDVRGRFLAAINREGPAVAYTPVERVSVPLAPGETATVPIEDPLDHRTESPADEGEPDATYHLRWIDGRDEVVFGDR